MFKFILYFGILLILSSSASAGRYKNETYPNKTMKSYSIKKFYTGGLDLSQSFTRVLLMGILIKNNLILKISNIQKVNTHIIKKSL